VDANAQLIEGPDNDAPLSGEGAAGR